MSQDKKIPRITLRAVQLADRVYVQVEDNRGGIPAALIARIFEPYFTTKQEGKDTGIRLYMSRMVVRGNLQGNMGAENMEGGTRITMEIFLPAT